MSQASSAADRGNERTLNLALHGCETFDFGPADLPILREQLRAYPAFSIHAPLPTPVGYPGSPVTSFLLDPDPTKRQASLDMLRATIRLGAEWRAEYVVVHFGGLRSDGLSSHEVNDLAQDAAARLSSWAQQYDMPLHLEYAAYNPSFARPEDLLALVTRHSCLHVCLDLGHLRISAEILGMDEWATARMLAPYTRSMHLWTTRGRPDVRRYYHVPVHPSLSAAEGWVDVRGMLELVLDLNPRCAIVFEPHHLYNPDPSWQSEGVAWVKSIVGRYRS